MNGASVNTFERGFFEVFKGISDIVSVSILLCDKNKEIKNSNAKANKFLGLSSGVTSLFELFPAEEHNKLDRALEESSRIATGIKEIMNIRDESGKIVKCEILFREMRGDDGNPYFLLSVNPHLYQTSEAAPIHISVSSDELGAFINNKRVVQLIDDIRSSYPFTFIGKSKIQQEANKLEELLWLKDNTDTYILVNKKFGDALGLRPGQVEGRAERNFLPLYFLDFYKSLDNYMRDTLNSVIIEGIPYRGFASWQNYQTVEIPLYDSDNNVLAVIGLTQRIQRNTGGAEAEARNTALLEKVPVPVALFDKTLNFVTGSLSFKKEFQKLPLNHLQLNDLFSDELMRKIEEYRQSKTLSFAVDLEIPFKNDETLIYSCNFQKSFVPDDEIPQLLVTFEKKLSYDSVEELLRYKGRMYDTLIQLNPEPIFIYDAENLRFLEVNEAALQLYGYKREEFLQMDLTDLYSTEDIQSLLESPPGKERIPKFNGPYKQRKKSGEVLQVKIAKSAFLFEGREAHFNIVRNVSDDAAKSADSVISKSIYENTSDIMFITDSTGFIQQANRRASESFGRALEDLINSSVVEYVIDDDRSRLNTTIFFSGIEEPINVELTFKTAEGKTFEADVCAIPIIDTTQNLEIYNLIIKRKQEEIIREVKKEVIREVYVPIEQEAPPKSDTASQSAGIDPKQIGTIFHEILTPINVILGFVQELKDSIEKPSQEQVEAVDYINQNRENMMDIMNSISEYSQLSAAGQLEENEVNIAELIETVQREEAEFFIATEKRLAPGKVSTSLSVISDKQKTKMLIANLCKVALRISDEPQIYFSAAQHDDAHFILSFRDNFAKVSEKLLTNFESFLNGTNPVSPKNFQLSRYNFATLKLLLQKLNGKYELVMRSGKPYEIGFILALNVSAGEVHASEQGGGFEPAEFSFPSIQDAEPETPKESVVLRPAEEVSAKPAESLEKTNAGIEQPPEISVPPAERFSFRSTSTDSSAPSRTVRSLAEMEETMGKETAQPNATEETPPVETKPHLTTSEQAPPMRLSDLACLYIEDQVDSQVLFKVQMKDMKDIKFAASFEEALPLLTSQSFDLIVMDINLQGEYNGLDALKMIRMMPGLNMPIVAVTAYVLPGDKEKFILAGFNDFISKPIFREKLLEVMEKLFKRKILIA